MRLLYFHFQVVPMLIRVRPLLSPTNGQHNRIVRDGPDATYSKTEGLDATYSKTVGPDEPTLKNRKKSHSQFKSTSAATFGRWVCGCYISVDTTKL